MLTVHANQLLVARKHPFSSPVHPQVLNAFLSDPSIMTHVSEYVHSANILVMPIHYSPLLIYLARPQPWTYRYTDSLKMLTMLWSIIQCYTCVDYPKKNAERITKAREELIVQIEALNERMRETLRMETFFEQMETFTIERINLHEVCLLRIFGMDVPVLTPMEFKPDVSALEAEARLKLGGVTEHFFKTKERLMNVRLETNDRYFTLDQNQENPYKGYMCRKLALEYFNCIKG